MQWQEHPWETGKNELILPVQEVPDQECEANLFWFHIANMDTSSHSQEFSKQAFKSAAYKYLQQKSNIFSKSKWRTDILQWPHKLTYCLCLLLLTKITLSTTRLRTLCLVDIAVLAQETKKPLDIWFMTKDTFAHQWGNDLFHHCCWVSGVFTQEKNVHPYISYTKINSKWRSKLEKLKSTSSRRQYKVIP